MSIRQTIFVALGVACLAVLSDASRADDLPQGASEVLERLHRDVNRIERQADRQIAEVMQEVYAIEDQTAEEARELTLAAIEQLKLLQEEFTRAGNLDEALVIRERVRAMEEELEGVEVIDDSGYIDSSNEPGTVLYIRVTADADYGGIWGTDIYTYDSSLRVAVVHSGALRDGETGIVRVTILPGQESYVGSERNGVSSSRYSSYSLSYRVDPAGPIVRAQERQSRRDQQRPPNAEQRNGN